MTTVGEMVACIFIIIAFGALVSGVLICHWSDFPRDEDE
jgi:hypothetical protein